MGTTPSTAAIGAAAAMIRKIRRNVPRLGWSVSASSVGRLVPKLSRILLFSTFIAFSACSDSKSGALLRFIGFIGFNDGITMTGHFKVSAQAR
ncbi:hypothetical protein D3C84_1100750 [compost metagenome]